VSRFVQLIRFDVFTATSLHAHTHTHTHTNTHTHTHTHTHTTVFHIVQVLTCPPSRSCICADSLHIHSIADINFTHKDQEGTKLAELEDTIRQRFADVGAVMPDGHLAAQVLRSLSPTNTAPELTVAPASEQTPRVFVS
jgi:hypothetical protein